MLKRFFVKDFIFNNGLVNLHSFLEEKNFRTIYSDLYPTHLELRIENDEDFNTIFATFLKEFHIIYQTDNKRWYFDEKLHDFVLDYKFDSKGGHGNDLRNGVYLYKNLKELGLTKEEAWRLYEAACRREGVPPKEKVIGSKGDILIHITLDEAIRRYIDYVIKGDFLKLDSKIHTFEDGQETFHDLLKQPKNYRLDKWEALIYWFGGRIRRYFYTTTYIYPNSNDLEALFTLKNQLHIQEDPIDKDGKKLPTNIEFEKQLQKDGITNDKFYISRFAEEFELKFFLYLFSLIYHIEDSYDRLDPRRKRIRQALFEAMRSISFVLFVEEGDMKKTLSEYTKTYRLLMLLKRLKETDLFDYLASLLTTIATAKPSKEHNEELRRFCQNFLNFSDLRKPLYRASFAILQNEKQGFGKQLYELLEHYVNFTKGANMPIHQECKIVGEGIGLFCANTDNKDLLFKLRNIKNFKQLVSFFKDLEFEALKNEEAARFGETFDKAMESIIQNENEWELARDYIAIYAIDKYRSAHYAKTHKEGE